MSVLMRNVCISQFIFNKDSDDNCQGALFKISSDLEII